MVKGDSADCQPESLEDGVSADSERDSLFEERVCPGPTRRIYATRERETLAYNATSQTFGVLCFTCASLLLCVLAFLYCTECLFMILIISACLCPFFHPMNAPLWLAIVLLTVGGWNFTMGALTVTWNYKG